MPSPKPDHRPLLSKMALSTPSLVMDLDVVGRRVDEFRSTVGDWADIHYAVKSNPASRVLDTLHERECSFDIASAAELRLVLQAGADPANVMFSSPVKRQEQIAAAYNIGVRQFAVGSMSELEKVLTHTGPDVTVLIRLALEGEEAQWPQANWGVSRTSARSMIDRLRSRPTGGTHQGEIGIAFHVGSQAVPGVWGTALGKVGDLMADLPDVIGIIDIGGGFPAAYRQDSNSHLDTWIRIGAELVEARTALPYQPHSWISEPGRALVADAGTLYTSVMDLNTDHNTVHIDAGAFHGLFEASVPGGGIEYQWDYFDRDIAVTSPMIVAGMSCDSDDRLAQPVELPVDLALDEYLAVRQTGAYSLSYRTEFCGLESPSVLAIEQTSEEPPDYEVAVSGSDAFEEATRIEFEVFDQSGFLESDGTLTTFRAYDPISRFIIMRESDGSIGSAMRMAPASDLGFTALHSVPIDAQGWAAVETVGTENITEIITLSSRGASLRTSVAAYAAGWFDSRALGRNFVMAAIDTQVLEMLERRLGMEAFRLGKPLDYMGSPTVGILLDLRPGQQQKMRESVFGRSVLASTTAIAIAH